MWVATAREVFLLDGRTFVRTGVAAAAADHLFGHLPGGSAGIDLSTPIAWRAERADRVVETRTMLPAGIELGKADRRTLAE